MSIREIREQDDYLLSEIIRSVMTEFKADPQTTVLGDPSIDSMYNNYQLPRSIYYVVEDNNLIVGGSGIKQLDGTDDNICELQRMFLIPSARGKGYGKALMDICVQKAKEFEYDQIYLESLIQMGNAIRLYEMTGFERISNPKGNTGHSGCNVFMILNLNK